MAALCPQCGTSLDQDFGVVSCSQCHAVLVIDLDGQIEIQQQDEQQEDQPQEEPHLELNPLEANEVSEFREIIEEPEIVEEPAFLSPDPEPVFIPDPPQALSSSSSGVISYHVTIEGIDTKELRVHLEEALSDPKFPWTARDVVKQTNQGILELGPMNPVAASVLVRKLKDLPFTVNWKQRIYE